MLTCLQQPRPLDDDRLHSFNYNRQWLSLCQDRVREELLKHLANGRRARLPRLFHDSTDHELALLREKYSKNGQSRLYETRKDNRNVPQSSTPFVVVSLCPWPIGGTDANSVLVYNGQSRGHPNQCGKPAGPVPARF